MAPSGRFAPLPNWPERDEPISSKVDGVAVFVHATRGLMLPGGEVEVGVTGEFDRGIARELRFKIEFHEITADASPVQLLGGATVLSAVPASHRPDPDGERLHVQIARLFTARLPATTPAYYRLRTAISDAEAIATSTEFITVIEQHLEVELELKRTRVSPGEDAPFLVLNLGPGPLFFGDEYRLERLEHGCWRPFALPYPFTSRGHSLLPGGTREFTMRVPNSAPPGRYRLRKYFEACGTRLTRTITKVFEVQT